MSSAEVSALPAVTIDNLDPWPCNADLTSTNLKMDDLEHVFSEHTVAQQHLDFWTVLTAYCGNEMTDTFEHWTKARPVTIEYILRWKRGLHAVSPKVLKPTGAQKENRIIKRTRIMQEDVKGNKELVGALIIMELTYILLMYGKSREALERLILDYEMRLLHLRTNLPIRDSTIRVSSDMAKMAAGGPGGAHDGSFEATARGWRISIDPDTLPELVGYGGVLESLRELIEISQLYPHLMHTRYKVGSQSILLFGPSGTGKTLMAQTLAAEQGLAFFKVPADELTSKWVGDTEKMLQALSNVARAEALAILFIDEIDYITRERTREESSFDRRSKNFLLELFNLLAKNSSILIIGATNRPWELDTAFLSRFGRRVFVDLQSVEDGVEMVVTGNTDGLSAWTSEELISLRELMASIECSGRDIEEAIGNLRLEMLRRPRRSSTFAPTSRNNDLWEPCPPDHPAAKVQTPRDWP